MILAAILFCGGLALSAFFSGAETGFYRVPRVRLVIDGVAGSRIAKGLLWASNHPAAFVATALVGNNVANYLTSLAIVIAAGYWMPGGGLVSELLPPLLVAPVVFIYGELLPKRAFLDAPYRLLRACAPALSAAAVVLAPLSGLLWLISNAVSRLTGASSEPLRTTLRRRELAGVFSEGQAAGVLAPAQRELAMATFALGGRPVKDFMTPVGRQPRVPAGSPASTVISLARRHRQDALPIEAGKGRRGEFRCVRASRCLTAAEGSLPIEDLPEFDEATPFLRVITQLESNAQPLAAVRHSLGTRRRFRAARASAARAAAKPISRGIQRLEITESSRATLSPTAFPRN